jgi:hypothetical protein
MNHLTEAQLNDLADGAADGVAQAHLDACAHCRGQLEQLRALLADLTALPGMPPARNLLPGIHAAIDGEQRAPDRTPAASGAARLEATRRARRFALPFSRVLPASRHPSAFTFPSRALLATAALLLIVTTALLTRALVLRTGSRPDEPRGPGVVQLVNADTRALEQNYVRAIADLERLIQAQRAQLAPTTLRLLEENIRVIDRAIRESLTALQQDPDNPLLGDWLRSAYQRKLDLLRHATAAPAT